MTTRAQASAENFSHTPDKLAAIRAALTEEYRKRHSSPWIVAYSGGKDSTLLLQLVFETMLALPAEERKRRVHVVGNDTGVESPLVIDHLRKSIDVIRKAITKMNLPVATTITVPCIDQTFWVNVIGRGYIPPTRNFRWCTDRMKISPTNRFIQYVTSGGGRSVLLIGTRKSESASRRRRMENYAKRGRRMNAHNQIKNCRIFAPLAELTDSEVWATLLQSRPPWGGTHRNLITLYRNAQGGKCPPVLSKADAPACGSTNRSLASLVDSRFWELRAWILALRKKDENRMPILRDGSTKYRADGSRVRGPFKMEVRHCILKQLKALETETGKKFLCKSQEETIEDIWRRDKLQYSCWEALIRSVGATVPA